MNRKFNSSPENFRLLTLTDTNCGEPFDVLVDLSSHFKGVDDLGVLLVETWTAYGRPEHGRWTVGVFGNSFVDTEPCDYVPIYRLLSLDPSDGSHTLLDTPVFHERHPQRYSLIANRWAALETAKS